MIGLAIVLACSSAIFHALWNLRLKASEDPLRTAAVAVPAGAALVTPLAALLWLLSGRPAPSLESWAIAVLSGGVELAYFHTLSEAYRRGEVSSVYPVARGTAPVLAAAIGLFVLGERVVVLQAAGVAVLIGGIWMAGPPVGRGPALVHALLTGALIATYQSIDAVGVRTGPWWLYAWQVLVCRSLWLLPWARRGRLREAVPAGLSTTVAYSMVLAALSLAPLALVAPLRETGVVLVGLWGVLRMGERRGAPFKLGGAVAVLAGATILAVH
jgi:drug/metabolite transporter (DMT)-like permease